MYRVFCCFDEGKLIILFNAFQKKSQKKPKNELELAQKLKSEYLKKRHGK
ncbi:MAG: type II toxin-antitoxin system RelE/ParE family toxin [Algoriphagus aquaeductus]